MFSVTPTLAGKRQSALTQDQQALIDEFGELLRKIAEAEVRITREVGVDRERLEAVKTTINAWFEDTPAGDPAVEEGQLYFLEASQREYHREIPIKAKRKIFALLKTKLGADPLGLFDITQEAIKAHLGKAVLDELAVKERTGPRRYKVVAKAPPAA